MIKQRLQKTGLQLIKSYHKLISFMDKFFRYSFIRQSFTKIILPCRGTSSSCQKGMEKHRKTSQLARKVCVNELTTSKWPVFLVVFVRTPSRVVLLAIRHSFKERVPVWSILVSGNKLLFSARPWGLIGLVVHNKASPVPSGDNS